MNSWNFSFLIILLPVLLIGCGEKDHLQQAIKYAEAAVIAHDGKTIVKHSEIARNHAYSANNQEKFSSSDRIHLAAAIVSLDQAIEKGKYDAEDSARKAARIARAHFKEVIK
jgi:hypothetical protein